MLPLPRHLRHRFAFGARRLVCALTVLGCGTDATTNPTPQPPKGPVGTFSLQAPSTLQMSQGGTSAFDVTVQGTGGFTGNVTITLEGHGGLVPTYATLQAPPGQRITVTAPNASPPGVFPITVRGTSPGHPDQTAVIQVQMASTVQSVRITPNVSTLNFEETREITATALGGVGEVIPGRPVHWSAFTPGVIEVVSTGGDNARVTGIGEGGTFVEARVDGVVGRDIITVRAAPVASMEVIVPPTVGIGSSITATAELRNSRGAILNTTTRVVTWSVTNQTGIADLRADGARATLTGVQGGTVLLTATSEGKSASVSVLVGGAPATRLTSGVPIVDLATTTGGARYFVITVPANAGGLQVATSGGTGNPDLFFRRGQYPTRGTADCASTRAGSEEFCGRNTPAAGEWYILLDASAPYSGVTLTATVTTGPIVVPVFVSVTPATASLNIGQTQQLTASVTGSTNTAVTWSASPSGIVDVSSTGVVTGRAAGSATVTARSVADPTRSATSQIVVAAPTPLVTEWVGVVSDMSFAPFKDGLGCAHAISYTRGTARGIQTSTGFRFILTFTSTGVTTGTDTRGIRCTYRDQNFNQVTTLTRETGDSFDASPPYEPFTARGELGAFGFVNAKTEYSGTVPRTGSFTVTMKVTLSTLENNGSVTVGPSQTATITMTPK